MLVPPMLLTALVSLPFSYSFISLHRSSALRWRAWLPISELMGFDMAAALGTYYLLFFVGHLAVSRPGVWMAFTAGVAGPGILRGKPPPKIRNWLGGWWVFSTLRSLRDKADADIDEICIIEESAWVGRVLRSLSDTPVETVRDLAVRALRRASRKKPSLAKFITNVQHDAQDATVPEYVRKEFIVQKLLDGCGHRAVRSLMRQAKGLRQPRAVKAYRFPRRLTLGRLRRVVVVPKGFRKERRDGRLRIGSGARHADYRLKNLSCRLRSALLERAEIDGMYDGWIVIKPIQGRAEKRIAEDRLNRLRRQIEECYRLTGLVQTNAAIVNRVTGFYAVAALAVFEETAERISEDYCGDAFTGYGVKLVVEIADGPNNRDYDIHKAKVYASVGVPHYLIIDFILKKATLYSKPPGFMSYRPNPDMNGGKYASEPLAGFDAAQLWDRPRRSLGGTRRAGRQRRTTP